MTTLNHHKSEATALAVFLRERLNLSLKHTHCLHAVAAMHGFENWNTFRAIPSHTLPPDPGKLQAHLKAKLSLDLSDDLANEAIAKLCTTMDHNPPRANGHSVPASRWPAVQPIEFKADSIDAHSWRVTNPNPLAGRRLDEVIDALQAHRDQGRESEKLERDVHALAEQYPGDLEALHSWAVAENKSGNSIGALGLWRRAWSIAEPGVVRLLDEDKSAIVSYNWLENRPMLRVLHGLTCSLLFGEDDGLREEGLKLAKMGYSLTRDRDSLGFRHVYAMGLARRGLWRKLITFTGKFKDIEFLMLALRAGAMAHLHDERLDGVIRQLIRKNPFGAEILLHGVCHSEYDDAHGVSLGSWDEGASHLHHNPELWKPDGVHKVWGPYRNTIAQAQRKWLTDFWATRLGEDTVSGHYDSMAFALTHIPPDGWGFKPFARTVRPQSLALPTLKISEETVKVTTEALLNRWQVAPDIRSLQVGRMLEWVIYKAVEKGAARILLVPGEETLRVLLERGGELDTFVELKKEYSDGAVNGVHVLCGHTCWRTDKQSGQFYLLHNNTDGPKKILATVTWNRRAVRGEIAFSAAANPDLN